MNSDFEVRLARLEKLGGDITKVYNSDFEVSLAILEKLSGQPQNANDYNSVYEVDVEILKYEGGGSPTPPTPTEPVEDTIWFENTTSGTTTTLDFNAVHIQAKNISISQDGINYAKCETKSTYTFMISPNKRIYIKYTPTFGYEDSATGAATKVFSFNYNIKKMGGELKNGSIPYMYKGWFASSSLEDISELTIESDVINHYACCEMFNRSSVKNCCKIKTNVAGNSAFKLMFGNCNSLLTPPIEFTAKSVGYNCCYQMFYMCKALTEAPELPATVISKSCYAFMFHSCSALTKGPTVLPAENVGQSSYNQMFIGCTSLTEAPDIMAKNISKACMQSMFSGCTSLVNAPSDLYAEYDDQSCYNGMFNGCTSLLKAPKIHLREVRQTNSIQNMFNGCTSLNEIYVEFLTYNNNTNVFANVAETGTLYMPKNVDKSMLINIIPSGWTIDQTVIDCFPENLLIIKNEDTDVNHITLSGNTLSTTYNEPSIFFYSTDNGQTYNEFNVMDRNSFDVALGVGESLYVKGFYNIKKATQQVAYAHQWQSSGKISISGEYKNGGDSILRKCFSNNKNIIDASGFVVNMPLKGADCYCMFDNCSNLLHPCQLPQTTISSSSYAQMFCQCSALTEIPELPATTIEDSGYGQMFQSCTSLTGDIVLNATYIDTTAYEQMFYGCDKITSVKLYVETINRYALRSMFGRCTNLREIYCNSVFSVDGYANGWVNGVSSTGTFYYNPKTDWALTIERGNDTIPTNWSVQPWLSE